MPLDIRRAYLAQSNRPLYPEVAHDPLQVGHNSRPLVSQVGGKVLGSTTAAAKNWPRQELRTGHAKSCSR